MNSLCAHDFLRPTSPPSLWSRRREWSYGPFPRAPSPNQARTATCTLPPTNILSMGQPLQKRVPEWRSIALIAMAEARIALAEGREYGKESGTAEAQLAVHPYTLRRPSHRRGREWPPRSLREYISCARRLIARGPCFCASSRRPNRNCSDGLVTAFS